MYSGPHNHDTEPFSVSTQLDADPILSAPVPHPPPSTSQSSRGASSSSSDESEAPDAGTTGNILQSPLKDYTSYAQLILRMAKTLKLDAQIPQQELDLVFQDMEQDKIPLPSLSLILAFLTLVKDSWEKSPSTLQILRKIEHHY